MTSRQEKLALLRSLRRSSRHRDRLRPSSGRVRKAARSPLRDRIVVTGCRNRNLKTKLALDSKGSETLKRFDLGLEMRTRVVPQAL